MRLDKEIFYNKAVDTVREMGYGSTSLLVSRLRIPYNTAVEVLQLLEERGVVGPVDGDKPIEVL